jgi:hypothetical protein
MEWWLSDSIDGELWFPVEDTLGEFKGTLGSVGTSGTQRASEARRFAVPFGPRLAVAARRRTLWGGEDPDQAAFADVVATVFWRKLG